MASSTLVRSLNRLSRVSTASPHPASVSSSQSSAARRVTRTRASTFPVGASSHDQALRAVGERQHVLAELALQEGAGFGPGGADDVTVQPHRVAVSHGITSRRAAADAAGAGHGRQEGGRLVAAFEVLVGGVAVGDDAGAGLDGGGAVGRHQHGADGDGGVEVAGEVEVADHAGVRAPLGRLQLVDDLHGPHLRRARDGAGRQGGPQHVDRARGRRAGGPTPARSGA